MKKLGVLMCALIFGATAYASDNLHCKVNKSLKPCGDVTMGIPDHFGGSDEFMDFSGCPKVGISLWRATGSSETSVTFGYIDPKQKPSFASDRFSTLIFVGEIPKSFKIVYGSQERTGFLGLGGKIGVYIEADCTQE